ncbi:MAG: hypothetical protein AAF311_10430 [Pseudomonadota bacterium]
MTPRPDRNAPLWTVANLLWIAQTFDRQVKPKLFVIAIISAVMSALGVLQQFDNPTFADLMLSVVIGGALLAILAIFWTGAWLAPELAGKNAMRVYLVVAVLGFLACFGVSTTANLSATGGVASLQIGQKEEIDRFDNEGAEAALYVDQLVVARDAIAARAELARQAEADEIAGRGPTGIGGVGSVSNSFGAARVIYTTAAASLDTVLVRARSQVEALAATVAEMRVVQADGTLSPEERATQLKVLSSRAAGDIRGLLALDPARSIQAAADAIAVGVPPRSQASASSQARITEISADMRAFANTLRVEADRIATLTPEVPEQVTRSHTEVLIAAAWRMPALLMVAILLDGCGWIAIGWRVAIYSAVKTKMREEEEEDVPSYVTVMDLWRVAGFVDAITETRNRVERADGKRRRRNPPTRSKKPKLPRKPYSRTTRMPAKPGKGEKSDD